MRSSSEIKILRWLGQFPPALESVWDVTREISLPGMAEALGVVRSSLNIPLKSLQEDEYPSFFSEVVSKKFVNKIEKIDTNLKDSNSKHVSELLGNSCWVSFFESKNRRKPPETNPELLVTNDL